ncbi:hypothetical protein CERSUDRAFT_112650 [Gelatoporia subvermispora B]|uniref:RanBP2-type domain-containing protein n=1 Tax=Ceriporiopsis subvermispora (strain B) TaxID=914234 RepID=M2PQV3_CERS8|nr:hypothetical protein CERSUDRAFT_112650 [Gelatoporia subvermispora B]
MSGVVRNTGQRRTVRAGASLPYSRPSIAKKSSWSISNILSYFNPLKALGIAPEEHGREEHEGMQSSVSEPAIVLSARGEEIQSHLRDSSAPPSAPPRATRPSRPPPSRAAADPPVAMSSNTQSAPFQFQFNYPLPAPSTSSTDNLKVAAEFLSERVREGKALNPIEYAGVCSLLGGSQLDPEPKREPFRFESTPSTPREGSPTPLLAFVTPSTSGPNSVPDRPRVPLTKNPNGEYRYQGIGLSRVSARKQNHYQSPGFGPSRSSRPMPQITVEKPKPDTKRRRMGEIPSTSSQPAAGPATSTSKDSTSPVAPTVNGSSTSSTSATSTSAPTTNGIPSASVAKPNGTAEAAPVTPPRSCTSAKPTAPAKPSPLRQAWGQSDSPPQASPPQKQTRAASFMSEILKEVTPPKKLDIVNPYQTANPIPRPPKKPLVRKPREPKPAEPPKQPAPEKKDVQISAQAAIEATVPKGSKRARPPPDLQADKPTSVPVFSPFTEPTSSRAEQRANGINGTRTSHTTIVIEEAEDEDMPSPPKKSKVTSPPLSRPQSRAPKTVTVEEVDDVDMGSSKPSYTLPSEVVEPGEGSKDKRESSPPGGFSNPFAPQGSPQRPLFAGVKSSAPRAPSKLRFSFQAEKEEKEEEIAAAASLTNPSPAPATSAPAPQIFMPFQPPKSTTTQSAKLVDAKAAALAAKVDELPKYTFALPTSSPGAGPSTYRAKESARVVPTTFLPSYDFSAPVKPSAPISTFNWAAAGMKPPSQPSADTWTCSVCSLSNAASAKEKCTICEAPRPEQLKAAPTTSGFNWSAAGMKPPSQPSEETWNCSVCLLSNSSSAKEKCTICEAPRPDQPKAAPTTSGFNWVAAGMKPPPAAPMDSWTCSTCMLSNPGSASKCTVCESPR